MTTLQEIEPKVSTAHPYTFVGSFSEGTRKGYKYAFHLFLEGKGYVTIADRKMPVDKGSLLFIRPGTSHSFHHTSGSLYSLNVYCDLWPSEDNIPEDPQFAFGSEPFRSELASRAVRCPELDGLPELSSIRAFPQLSEQIALTVKLYDSSLTYSAAIVNSLAYAWILQWFNLISRALPSDFRILKVIGEMERYPGRQVPYEEWCRKCGLEKTYFYRLFKQETGMTPKEFQLKEKMKLAAAMLRESNRTASSIAEELGYSSIHYFSKQFTDYYSMTSSSFRNRQR